MKKIILAILLLSGFKAQALDEQAGDVCQAWTDYNSQNTEFLMVKQSMAQQGLDINEIEPETVARVKVLKGKLDREKKKFKTKTKKNFDKSMCSW
jgi:hypothetical protein